MTDQQTSWVQRAGRAKLKAKAQAVVAAASFNTEGWAKDSLAAGLREVINQCQNGQGVIAAAELCMLADYLDQPP
jgi:hypothetical protein